MMRYLWIIVSFSSWAVLSQAGCVGCALGPQPEPPDLASAWETPTNASGDADGERDDDDDGASANAPRPDHDDAGQFAGDAEPCLPPADGAGMDGPGAVVVWPFDPRDVWQAQGGGHYDGGPDYGDGGADHGDAGAPELDGDVDGAIDGGDAMPHRD